MGDLDLPLKAVIESFDKMDEVGRVVVESGEVLKFGRSACKGFQPEEGETVFVTSTAPHPLGGMKATSIRREEITEAAYAERQSEVVRAANEKMAAAEAARMTWLKTELTADAIVQRIVDAVDPDEDNEADVEALDELIDDLELVGPSLDHVEPILKGIAESEPTAFFGSPGPLVHYVERFADAGMEEILLRIASARPVAHFIWLLARQVNDSNKFSARAEKILKAYTESEDIPRVVREEARTFLANR